MGLHLQRRHLRSWLRPLRRGAKHERLDRRPGNMRRWWIWIGAVLWCIYDHRRHHDHG